MVGGCAGIGNWRLFVDFDLLEEDYLNLVNSFRIFDFFSLVCCF
jgi:hypothetical protein